MLKVKLIDEKLTYCLTKEKPGNCFAVQVFDSYGYNVAQIDSEQGVKRATKYAKLFAASLDMYKALKAITDRLPISMKEDLLSEEYSEAINALKKAGF